MLKYEKAERIPSQGNFKIPKETYEYAALFESLEPGEVFKFALDDALSDKEQHNEHLREKARMRAAIKLIGGEEFYKVASRKKVLYVEKL